MTGAALCNDLNYTITKYRITILFQDVMNGQNWPKGTEMKSQYISVIGQCYDAITRHYVNGGSGEG